MLSDISTGIYFDNSGRIYNIKEDEGRFILQSGSVIVKYRDKETLLKDFRKRNLKRKK